MTTAPATTLTLAYINAGRGSATKVRALWRHVASAARNADVIVAVEVDEGDKGYSDHQLVRRALGRFHRAVFRRSREVILTVPGLKVLERGVRRAGRSVRHWSPSRPVSYAVLAGVTPTRVVTGHPAAGTGTQAKNRPKAARSPLQASWDRTVLVFADVIADGVAAGQNVVLATDGNSRDLVQDLIDILPKHINLIRLAVDAPDYVLAFPAAGQQVIDVHATTFPNPIEPTLHPGHLVTVTFEPAAAA